MKRIYTRPPNFIFEMFGLQQTPEAVEVEVVEIDYDARTAVILLPVPTNSILGIIARRDGAPHPPPVRTKVPLATLS